MLTTHQPWGISAAAMYGGNPSQNGTAVPVIGFLEGGLLMGLKSSGNGCAVPPGDGNAAALSASDFALYDALRTSLRGSGRLSSGSACQLAFDNQADPSWINRAGDFGKLDQALQNQNAYDGPHSKLSIYKAGMMPPSSAPFPLAVRAAQNTAVCTMFVTSSGQVKPTRAAAQGWPYPGTSAQPTDIYINTDSKVLPLVDQGTLLHETLHNITGLEDYVAPPKAGPRPLDLKQYIGIPSLTGETTIDITYKLRSMSCVP